MKAIKLYELSIKYITFKIFFLKIREAKKKICLNGIIVHSVNPLINNIY